MHCARLVKLLPWWDIAGAVADSANGRSHLRCCPNCLSAGVRTQGNAPSAITASDTASNGVLLALGAAGIGGAVVVLAQARGGSGGNSAPPPPSSGAVSSLDPQQSEPALGLASRAREATCSCGYMGRELCYHHVLRDLVSNA